MESKKFATSLFKALDLLSLISLKTEGMPIGALVAEMELPRSSVIRVLDSLIHYGLLERDAERRYKVTTKFRDWRMADFDSRLVLKFRPLMNAICQEIGEMVVLGRLRGRRIQHLHSEEPDCRVRVVPPIGREFATRQMAMGKLVLSQRPDMLPQDCEEETLAAIKTAKQAGFAWNRGESEPGIVAWGTWLGEASPLTPMLAITWPDFRYSDVALERATALLRKASAEIGPFALFGETSD